MLSHSPVTKTCKPVCTMHEFQSEESTTDYILFKQRDDYILFKQRDMFPNMINILSENKCTWASDSMFQVTYPIADFSTHFEQPSTCTVLYYSDHAHCTFEGIHHQCIHGPMPSSDHHRSHRAETNGILWTWI